MVDGTWANKLRTKGGTFSCFSSPVDAQALAFFDDTVEHGFEEPTVPDHLLREFNFALDALLLAVETRDEAAVLIMY